MKSTKKELERALEMAVENIKGGWPCLRCPVSEKCFYVGHIKALKSHFLALAKQGKKEGK